MTSNDPSPLGYRTKVTVLLNEVRKSILQGEYRNGDFLRQNKIAKKYGVSPTPVREVLRILEAEGLVMNEPNRGFRVADWSGHVGNYSRLRAAVETLAVEMLMETTITDELVSGLRNAIQGMQDGIDNDDSPTIIESHRRFHELIYSANDFPALQEVIRTIWARFPWDINLSIGDPQVLYVNDHNEILQLIIDQDCEKLLPLYRRHIFATQVCIDDLNHLG